MGMAGEKKGLMVFHSRRTLAMSRYLEIILDVHRVFVCVSVCVCVGGWEQTHSGWQNCEITARRTVWRRLKKRLRLCSEERHFCDRGKSRWRLNPLRFYDMWRWTMDFMWSAHTVTNSTNSRRQRKWLFLVAEADIHEAVVFALIETIIGGSRFALLIAIIIRHRLTQPSQRMFPPVFGPRPERQELCAVLDIPSAPALSEECDCQAVGIVEVAARLSA